MISHLTKLEYYMLKNIPLCMHTQPLEPLPPLSQHLLEPIPSMGHEVEKILNTQEMEKNLSLELANANKIIHTLEEEVELVLEKNNQFEDQLNEVQGENSRLHEKVEKLKRRLESA